MLAHEPALERNSDLIAGTDEGIVHEPARRQKTRGTGYPAGLCFHRRSYLFVVAVTNDVTVTGTDEAVVVVVKRGHPAKDLFLRVLAERAPLGPAMVRQPGVGGADCSSSGTAAKQLLDCKLWRNGFVWQNSCVMSYIQLHWRRN